MFFQPARHFTAVKAAQPEISESELLNSNNNSEFTGKADVVVAGAGIIGLIYAIQLKTFSPHLKIAVFEKSASPTQKIGESTLSSFSRFTDGTMLPNDYLFRLFGMKDGLQFYCLDAAAKQVTCEDVGGLDLSFQLDRRMSELFFTMWAQSLGINVYHGVELNFDLRDTEREVSSKPFQPPIVTAKNYPSSSDTQIDTRLICDASGFSRKLTSKFGNKEHFPGWNCDAYWAYFKSKGDHKAEASLDHWDYPATKHMCFPEGWGWFIKLISWHKAPLANLMDMVAYIIDNAKRGVPAARVPCTNELSRMFGCPFEYITSIGWAVRNDYKFPDNLDSYGETEGERKFQYFQKKYPTLDGVMNDVYELLPNYYGARTYFVRKTMTYQSPVVAGDGWFAVGNSAGFTNPLISPGINAGIETAYLAATLTRDVLDAPDEQALSVMQTSSEKYQAYSHDFMMPRLSQMNRFWYTMFRDHRLFDALVKCFWACGVGAVNTHYKGRFDADDLKWLVGAGGDEFQELCSRFFEIVNPLDAGPVSSEVADEVCSMSRECLASRTELYPGNAWGKYLRKYSDNLKLVEGKHDRDTGGNCSAVRCQGCKSWVHNLIEACPICGRTMKLLANKGWLRMWMW